MKSLCVHRKVAVILLVIAFMFIVSGCSGNNLNGRWEAERTRFHVGTASSFVVVPTFEFQGNNFYNFAYIHDDGSTLTNWGEFRGTFSISGDQIELVHNSGRVEVRSFSRTENTINIGGTRFTRIS